MQEPPMMQAGASDATRASIRELLDEAMMHAETLPKILHSLLAGSDLSLATWRKNFEESHLTLENINKAMTRAQEIFDEHEEEVAGALSEEMTCDEFQCLTWK
jgi:cell division ATPase FtsA